jgi:hypothetical protein
MGYLRSLKVIQLLPSRYDIKFLPTGVLYFPLGGKTFPFGISQQKMHIF